MERPNSIVTFERLYLASILVWLVQTVVFWNARLQVIADTPQLAANPQMAGVMNTLIPVTAAITLAVSLVFWYFAARRRSVVAKWFVVVTEAFGALFLVIGVIRVATVGSPNLADTLVGFLATVLGIAAAAMLLRPDARLWFGEPVEPVA